MNLEIIFKFVIGLDQFLFNFFFVNVMRFTTQSIFLRAVGGISLVFWDSFILFFLHFLRPKKRLFVFSSYSWIVLHSPVLEISLIWVLKEWPVQGNFEPCFHSSSSVYFNTSCLFSFVHLNIIIILKLLLQIFYNYLWEDCILQIRSRVYCWRIIYRDRKDCITRLVLKDLEGFPFEFRGFSYK